MFMLTCKQASRLVSQSLDRPLSWSELAQLKFHLFICKACQQFSQQLRLLRLAIKNMMQNTEYDGSIQLSSDAKNRITQAIISHTEPNDH
jgi:hypothetical protein